MSNETRNVPTRPGWWWREGNHGPYIEEVDGDRNHALFLAIDGSDVVDDGTWLAPIPGPDVLAALAEWSGAVFAWEGVGGREAVSRGKSVEFEAMADGIMGAEEALIAAIRAERDGAA